MTAGDGRRFEAERQRFANPEPFTPRGALRGWRPRLGSLVWIPPHILNPRRCPTTAIRCSPPGASRGSPTSSSPIRRPLRRQHLPSAAADADALGRDLSPGDARRALHPCRGRSAPGRNATDDGRVPAVRARLLLRRMAHHGGSLRRPRRRARSARGTHSTRSITAISNCTG